MEGLQTTAAIRASEEDDVDMLPPQSYGCQVGPAGGLILPTEKKEVSMQLEEARNRPAKSATAAEVMR